MTKSARIGIDLGRSDKRSVDDLEPALRPRPDELLDHLGNLGLHASTQPRTARRFLVASCALVSP